MATFVDVRDVARAHVLAISAPPLPQSEGDGGRKRLIIHAKEITWGDLLALFRSSSAFKSNTNDLKSLDERLPAPDAEPVMQMNVPIDASLTLKALPDFGVHIDFERTVVDAFEAILAWEKEYKNKE